MTHTAKSYDHLLGKLPGLSEAQLKAHFGLYQGYVNKMNEIGTNLQKADLKTCNYSFAPTSELLRRYSVAHNGTLLHELYFENLSPTPKPVGAELKQAIDGNFGSMEHLQALLRAGILSGHGWSLLTLCNHTGRLSVSFIEEHHRGILADQRILLSVDGWEHAYMIDYGTKKPDYLNTLDKTLCWGTASERFLKAK
jgi:superoxide dismutase, Fe-Mn family